MLLKKHIQLNHPRNHLKLIEGDGENQLFPPAVWSFMSKNFQKDGEITTGRKELLKQWQEEGCLDPVGKIKRFPTGKELLYSDGGPYNTDELSNRLKMYNLLQTEVGLIEYDLKRLLQEIQLGKKP